MASKLNSIVENPSWNKRQKKVFTQLQEALPTVMSYASGEIPVLDNHSDAQIVDELGPVKALKKSIETAEKAHAERLKARMDGKKKLDGEDYYAEIRTSERTAINQGLVKEFIDKCDGLQVDIIALLDAIAKKEVAIPNVAFLKVLEDDSEDGETMESNGRHFYSTSQVPALYIKEF